MGLRFRKRIKVAPGVHLNLSNTGVSTNVGVKGASVTYSKGKKTTTVGLPGTGITHVTTEKTEPNNNQASNSNIITTVFGLIGGILLGILALILSSNKPKRRR